MILVPPLEKRRILRTAQEAYGIVFSNFRLFLIAAAVPFVLSVLIELPNLKRWVSPDWVAIYWWGKLHYLPHTIVAVAWCRFVLLGREVAIPTFLPRWHPRLGRFFIILLPIILVFALVNRHVPRALYEAYSTFFLGAPMDPFSPRGNEFSVLNILIWFSSIYLLLRFSLLFPAIVIGAKSSFGASWKSTRSVSLRLLAAFILFYAPFHLVETITYDAVFFLFNGQSAIVSSIWDRPSEVIGSPWGLLYGVKLWGLSIATLGQSTMILIFDYLWVGLIASLISIAFRTCTGWVPGVSTLPAQSGASG